MTDRKILRQMRREEEMADILMGIAEGIARGAMAVAILLIAILFIAHSQPKEVQAAERPGAGWESAGTYKITFYCPCRSCSGQWDHQTSSGATCEEGVTAACAILPYGTRVFIAGFGERIVQDTGSGVEGHHLDLFLESHMECLDNAHGEQYREVWIKR